MLSADQVPVKTPHSRMQWHKWVVLIAGSTGSALRAVRPPNLHITPDVGAISLDLQRGRIIVALASSHHCPRHSGQLVGKRDRGDFGVSPCHQCLRPDRKVLGSATLATRAVASNGPTPGMQLRRLLVWLERCQAMIIRSKSKICFLRLSNWLPSAARYARTTSGTRLSLESATTRSSSSTPLRPTGATMPNSAR